MLPPTPFSTTHTSRSLLGSFYHSRRLLQPHNTPLSMALPPSSSGRDSSDSYTGESSFDANVIMILAVLLCALICALGLNSIIRCALRCSNRPAFDSGAHVSDRLANTGINRKVLKAFPTLTYSSDGLKLPGFDSRCAICLSEFADGEQVRVLPSCNHGFHVRCIDKWLVSHSSCPTCRQCLHNACQKLVACSPACPSVLPAPLQPVLVPTEPERLIINYTM